MEQVLRSPFIAKSFLINLRFIVSNSIFFDATRSGAHAISCRGKFVVGFDDEEEEL
jgi:hypothetical protein